MADRRDALIIATGEYEHEGLRDLRSPAADARALAGVLGDQEIGGFAVEVVDDGDAHTIRARIEDFFADRRPGDVLLLHLSCHGLKNEAGELYFTARDTKPRRLESTAVSADFVQRCLRTSRSRNVVLLLDCCYGGAFAAGVRVRAAGDVRVMDSFPPGRGRAVITASSSMEYAFEGDHRADDPLPRPSVFTSTLVKGLSTGEADLDGDGLVSIDELYEYVYDRVRERNPAQTPTKDIEVQGDLYLARVPRPRTPEELREQLLGDDLQAALAALRLLPRADAREALRDIRLDPSVAEIRFGPRVIGRTVQLRGPAIARAVNWRVSHEWIKVGQRPDGIRIAVDIGVTGPLRGEVTLVGPTGRATIAVTVEALPAEPGSGRRSKSARADHSGPMSPAVGKSVRNKADPGWLPAQRSRADRVGLAVGTIVGGLSVALGVVAWLEPALDIRVLSLHIALLGVYRLVRANERPYRWGLGGLSVVIGLSGTLLPLGLLASLPVLFAGVAGVAVAFAESPRVPAQIAGLAALVASALAIGAWSTPDFVAWVLGGLMIVQGVLLPCEALSRR